MNNTALPLQRRIFFLNYQNKIKGETLTKVCHAPLKIAK